MARSRLALIMRRGYSRTRPRVLSSFRHLQQPAAQFIRVRQSEPGCGRRLLAHAHADAAEPVHDLEGILVGAVVAGEYGGAVAKWRLLHEPAHRRTLGQVAWPDLHHTLAHQHAELAAEAPHHELRDLEHLAAAFGYVAVMQG